MIQTKTLLPPLLLLLPLSLIARPRWTDAQAQAWYQDQGWRVGCNFIPKDAVNELEMWQADTFDPHEIDWELGLAQSCGMTTVRVFLQDQLWTQDAAGLKRRMQQFLVLADAHHIKPLFVLFDSCWNPHPHLGKQPAPRPGLHNSEWVQSPGIDRLRNRADYPELEAYVKGIVGAFARDERILGWDVWNEPQDSAGDPVHNTDSHGLVAELLPRVFEWARSVDPIQPLTSPLFDGDDWSPPHEATLKSIPRTQLEQSDVISFHSYGWPEQLAARIEQLQAYGRPVICTEYMARSVGSTIDLCLPVGKKYGVAMFNWGLVDGKTQTRFPWDSYDCPYIHREPAVWFHDLFHADGKPYREREMEILRELTK
ncbi:MAG TPA: 1,4-beta-xylanase [Opitutaceae bacterium]|jgi:endo-1,4-beta-mannosidase